MTTYEGHQRSLRPRFSVQIPANPNATQQVNRSQPRQNPKREPSHVELDSSLTKLDSSLTKPACREWKTASLTQRGGSRTLVGFEPFSIAGATFRTLFGRFGRTIGTSRAMEV